LVWDDHPVPLTRKASKFLNGVFRNESGRLGVMAAPIDDCSTSGATTHVSKFGCSFSQRQNPRTHRSRHHLKSGCPYSSLQKATLSSIRKKIGSRSDPGEAKEGYDENLTKLADPSVYRESIKRSRWQPGSTSFPKPSSGCIEVHSFERMTEALNGFEVAASCPAELL
jgi:hypothetical protein